jgi:nitrogen regulatory protein PII
MRPVKRIEIVSESHGLREIRRWLDLHGVAGYTVIRDVTGRGERGVQSGDELSDVFTNAYLITTCPAADLARLVEGLRPLLRKHGGVCLVSDAHWVDR